MAPCYSKHAILQGAVDSFCLVCETYLKSEEVTFTHISKPIHLKNLDSAQYVKEFEEDAIRKTKSGYYCEFCNELVIVLAGVRAHVLESSHKNKKTTIVFQRDGLNVIAFGKVVLNDKSWNGFNGESCAVCNTEYENEDIHKNQPKHIVNLIRSTVEIDADKNVYRKIDEVLFQCLTCNLILATNNKKCHFEGDDHKNQYKKCYIISSNKTNCDETNERNEYEILKHNDNQLDEDDAKRSDDDFVSNNTVEKDDYYIKSINQGSITCVLCDLTLDPQDRVSHLNGKRHKKRLNKHKESIKDDLLNIFTECELKSNINLESESASCKKCEVSLPYSSDAIKKHIIEHNKKYGKEMDNVSVKKYGLDNGEKIAVKETTGKEENIKTKDDRDDIRSVEKGDENNRNNKNSDVSPKKPLVKINLKRILPAEFVKSVTTVEYMIFHDVIINEKYCISFQSLVFLTSRGSELECMVCNKVTNLDHFKKQNHENRINEIPIITNVEDEFIREIRKDLFHCGYCNVVLFSWNDLQEHFNSVDHKNSRTASEWKLQMYSHEIAQEKRQGANRLPHDMGRFLQMMRGMF